MTTARHIAAIWRGLSAPLLAVLAALASFTATTTAIEAADQAAPNRKPAKTSAAKAGPAAPPPAVPSDTHATLDEVIRSWPRLDIRQRYVVIEQVIAAGEFETASRLIADLGARSPTEKAMSGLLTGLLRRSQGRLDEAVDILRAILADNPSFARVRLELAVALFMKEDDEAARHNFELVLGSANSPHLAENVNRFIDAMHQRRRWSFASHVSLAPSTNFNQGTDTEYISLQGLQFRLDDSARRKSGIGLHGGFNGAYRAPVMNGVDLVVGGGASTRQFRETRFNDTVASGEVGPRVRFAWGDVGLYGTIARRWHGGEDWWSGDAYALSTGARLAARLRLDHRNVLTSNTACVEKKHDTIAWQDGWTCTQSLTLDHYLDIRTFLRVIGGAERERTERAWLDFDAGNVGFGAFREFGHGISLYGQLMYTRRDYRADFPGFLETRHDDRYEATLQVTKRDWTIAGLAPSLQYGYTRNVSSIDVFKYDAHGVNVTLTKTF